MSDQSVKLRPPATFDVAIAEEYQFLKSACTSIRFRHPAYPPEDNLLLILYAWDHADGGLHYGLAHTACAIIADNRFDGYLSTSNLSNSDPIVVAWDDVLPAGVDYYFHVPHPEAEPPLGSTNLDQSPLSPYRWPVVPSFQDWRFPSTLPECWRRCRQTALNIAPQSNFQCRVTAFKNGTEVAHLVPAHERAWFLSNAMHMWNKNTSLDSNNLLKDLSNEVLLRSDIHIAFDQRMFVFFPKENAGFALHMLQPTSDLGPLYHNRRLVIPECNIAFLFARFAWAIFPFLTGFLVRSARDRLVVRLDVRTGTRITEEAPAAVYQRDSIPLAGLSDKHGSRHDEQNTPGDATSEHEDAAKSVGGKLSVQNIPNSIDGQDETTFQHLCKTYLEKQRPEGYVPPVFSYNPRRPAREQLELMGVEILEDSFSDNDGESRDNMRQNEDSLWEPCS